MLNGEQFDRLFPFHVVLDEALRVLSAGSVLLRICPSLVTGVAFDTCFSLSRFGMESSQKFDRDFILTQQDTLLIFKSTTTPLVLRMQVLVLDHPTRYCFVGSPWLRTPTEMRELNLVLKDFAMHDSTVDLLQLIQSTGRSLEDAKRLASKLEVQRNDLKQLIDTANAPIVGVDAAGLVLEWNQSTQRLTGYTKPEALNVSFLATHVHPKSRAEVEKMIAEALAGHPTPLLEFELITKDGTNRLVICSASPRHDAAGVVIGAILVGQDITELGEYRSTLEQRVEERTRQLSLSNAELSRAMRSKDDFLSAMSHELRTPLTAVLGLSELLCEGVYGPLAQTQVKPVSTIAESGQHLLSLINDLLDVAKIGAGKIDLTWSIADVRGVCEAAWRLVTPMAQKKHQVISTRLDPTARSIRVDERRLKQILVNLLSNAVKFTPDGGRVTLETQADLVAQTLTFSVRDTGIGIAADDVARLFTPFTQLDSRLARQYSGTGLGLTLVSLLTEHHGGHVSVQSTLGEGSCFSATLPWQETAPTPSQADDKPHANANASSLERDEPTRALMARSPVIVNADDNDASLGMLGDFLRKEGFRVVDARDGAEAIAAVFKHHPALVIMDLQMPAMDGLSAIRVLRSNSAFEQTPIIALTSRALVGDRELCITAGASDYLRKPVNLLALLEMIHRLLLTRVTR